MIRSTLLFAVLATAASLGAAHAASLSYTGYVADTGNSGAFPAPIITVNDDSNPGFLSFSISSSGASGMLSGFFFDTSGIEFDESDIIGESVTLAAFGSDAGNVRNLGGGVNSNGGYPIGPGGATVKNLKFDAGIRIDRTDVSVIPFTFQISTNVLSLADILGDPATNPQFGFLRFQSVSGAGVTQGSSKVIGVAGQSDAAPVPLPAAAWLMLAALGGLVGLRRVRT